MFSLLFKLAFRNCLAHWRYSLASVLLLGLGLCSLWMFRGYMLGIEELYRDLYRQRNMLGDLIIESQQSTIKSQWASYLSHEEQELLQNTLQPWQDRLHAVIRFLPIEGEVSLGQDTVFFRGLAYDRAEGERMRGERWGFNAVAGRPLQKERALVLGQGLASSLGCQRQDLPYLSYHAKASAYQKIARPFACQGQKPENLSLLLQVGTESAQVNAESFALDGLIDASLRDIDRHWLMLDLSDAQRLYNTDKVAWYSLAFRENLSPQQRKTLEEELKAKGFLVKPWELHTAGDLYRRTMSLLSVFEAFVIWILFGILSLSIFNLMFKISQERRKEIGLFLALGYRSSQLRGLFILEALFATLVGLGGGTLLSWVLSLLINALGIPYKAGILSEPVPFFVTLSATIWGKTVIQLTLLAALASFLATLKVFRRSIIDNLVHQ